MGKYVVKRILYIVLVFFILSFLPVMKLPPTSV